MDSEKESILLRGRAVMSHEARAIAETAEVLGDEFVCAVNLILDCRGRVCVTGMGKAGLVGRKIQASLASTGTLSYCLHPAEALHGDLGMVHNDDVVVALSKSGSSEVAAILPILKKIGCKIILITAKRSGVAAEFADCILQIKPDTEACPLGLAPSTSTTAMLALGDALMLSVMEQRGFRPENYARNHPGGALGRSLMRVEEIMRTEGNCPRVGEQDSFSACYEVMINAPLRAGAAVVANEQGKLKGIVTQGDIFRFVMKTKEPYKSQVSDIMTANCKRLEKGQLVSEAIAIMRKYAIDELPVVDKEGYVAGLLDIQDVVAEGFEVS